MKTKLTIVFLLFVILGAKSQCSNFFSHTYNNFIVYPYSFTTDITGNSGATNLRIRTFQDNTGNKVILDNPNLTSTIKYSGFNDLIYTTNSCGTIIGNNTDWTTYGLLADSSHLYINEGTSYIKIRLSSNGSYIYGWLKIGITSTADSVFIYSLVINQTGTAPSFQVGQCDVTWPSVCTTGISEAESAASELNIYPNPATNHLNINLGGLQAEQVCIYDTNGQLISETKQPQGNSLSVSSLPAGIYVAEINVNGLTVRKRWVKM